MIAKLLRIMEYLVLIGFSLSMLSSAIAAERVVVAEMITDEG